MFSVTAQCQYGGERKSVTNSNAVPPWDFKRLESLSQNICDVQVTNWTDLTQLLSSIEDGTHTLTPEVLSVLYVHINICLDATLECLETTVGLKKHLMGIRNGWKTT